jgi:hypothetical protein
VHATAADLSATATVQVTAAFTPNQNIGGQQVQWATTSNQPTTITFDPVSTTGIRLDLTSPAPNTSTGFLEITELQVPADEVTG